MQARPFSIRAWDAALSAATELGLVQQATEAVSRIQDRKAALVLAVQAASDLGFQDADQASGAVQMTQPPGTLHLGGLVANVAVCKRVTVYADKALAFAG